MAGPFEKITYYSVALDPVHVGTGGYRLGRVDLTIVREPATRTPKVPGSSLAGAARAYTAMAIQSEHPDKKKYRNPVPQTADGLSQEGRQPYTSCAGKGGDFGEGHCGRHDCEVCTAYGFSKNKSSFQGLAQFFDAQILFFPVATSRGPVWVTSPAILLSVGQSVSEIEDDKFRKIVDGTQQNAAVPEKLNFGWLMLPLSSTKTASLDLTSALTPFKIGVYGQMLKDRLYLVPDRLFPRIVNGNLEVRTSVAISPATGAAEDKALYTYEAIPRGTILFFDVVYNKPEFFQINVDNRFENVAHGKSLGEGWFWIKENVEKGLKLMQFMGVGGMNTRGMGRLEVLNIGG